MFETGVIGQTPSSLGAIAQCPLKYATAHNTLLVYQITWVISSNSEEVRNILCRSIERVPRCVDFSLSSLKAIFSEEEFWGLALKDNHIVEISKTHFLGRKHMCFGVQIIKISQEMGPIGATKKVKNKFGRCSNSHCVSYHRRKAIPPLKLLCV